MLPRTSVDVGSVILNLMVDSSLSPLSWLSSLGWWDRLVALIALKVVGLSILRRFVSYKLPPEPIWIDIITVVFFIYWHLLLRIWLIASESSHVLHLLLVIKTRSLVQSVSRTCCLDLLHWVPCLLLVNVEWNLGVSLGLWRKLIVLHWWIEMG